MHPFHFFLSQFTLELCCRWPHFVLPFYYNSIEIYFIEMRINCVFVCHIYPFFILFGVPWRTDKQNFSASIESKQQQQQSSTSNTNPVVFISVSQLLLLSTISGCKCIELMVLVLVFRYNWKLYKKRARIKWNENILGCASISERYPFFFFCTFLHGKDLLFLWWFKKKCIWCLWASGWRVINMKGEHERDSGDGQHVARFESNSWT